MKLHRKINVLLFLSITLLGSCRTLNNIPTLPPTPLSDVTTVPSPQTTKKIDAVMSSLTPTPVISVMPSDDRSTRAPVSRPTLTYVPVLSSKEAESRAIELLKENGGCRLPCFLNIVPSKTSVQTIRSSLNAFKNIRHNVLFSEMGGGAGLFFLRNNSILDTHITIGGYRETQSDIIQWIEVTMTTYQEKNYVNEPIYNDPFFAQYFQYYSLSNLLSVYGPPENISIGIELAAQMRGLDQYYLFLDYSTSGWIALITMAAIQKEGDIYLGCPNDGFTSLRLWSPGDTEMARKYGINKESGYPWPLEKATSLTLDDFYQQFKVPTKQCLETNIDQLTFPK